MLSAISGFFGKLVSSTFSADFALCCYLEHPPARPGDRLGDVENTVTTGILYPSNRADMHANCRHLVQRKTRPEDCSCNSLGAENTHTAFGKRKTKERDTAGSKIYLLQTRLPPPRHRPNKGVLFLQCLTREGGVRRPFRPRIFIIRQHTRRGARVARRTSTGVCVRGRHDKGSSESHVWQPCWQR